MTYVPVIDAIPNNRPSDGAKSSRLPGPFLERQSALLDHIASGAPLLGVLEGIVGLVEEQVGDMRCAVLLLDHSGEQLRIAAAPNIPEDYKVGITPYLRLGPSTNSCATAAYRRQPVYTRDTAADPLWEDCGGVALRNGMRAVWSTPILSGDGKVLGTLGMGYGAPRLPSEDHIRIIAMATQMARLAIEASRWQENLFMPYDCGRGVVVADLVGQVKSVNERFAELLGYMPSELRGQPLQSVTPNEDYDQMVARLLEREGRDLVINRRYRRRDGETVVLRERWTLCRDAAGHARSAHGQVEQVFDVAQHPLEHLSVRELQVLKLVTAGHTSKEIAAMLSISAASIDTYRSRIMVKLGIGHLPGLVRFALENGVDP